MTRTQRAAQVASIAGDGGLTLRTAADVLQSFAVLDFPLSAEQVAAIQARSWP